MWISTDWVKRTGTNHSTAAAIFALAHEIQATRKMLKPLVEQMLEKGSTQITVDTTGHQAGIDALRPLGDQDA